MRRGHTLVELCAALLILTLGTSFLAPAVRRLRDRMAVVAAREAVAGLVSEARLEALARGEAVLQVRADSGSATVDVRGLAVRTVALRDALGVEVVLPGGRRAAELRYDALGLGQVASESVSFRRGSAEAGVVISAYGRVRRR